MATKELIQSIHSKVSKLFVYTHDQKNYGKTEDWRSHAKAVNEGKQFKDDCDGFALTCAELVLEQNVERKDVHIIICETETGETHLVCGVDIEDKDNKITYICDNRKDFIDNMGDMKGYKWKFFMTMSEPGQWYKVT